MTFAHRILILGAVLAMAAALGLVPRQAGSAPLGPERDAPSQTVKAPPGISPVI